MLRFVTFTLVAMFVGACSVGSQTEGKLPVLDGSALSGVSAAKVGQFSADEISAGTVSVKAATDAATAGAIVKRDANGNFSAGTISAMLNGNAASSNVAAFAMGKAGADLNSAATLALGEDGNFFKVKGTTDILTISARPAGQKVQLLFDGPLPGAPQLKLSNGVNLKLAGGGVFSVYPGDYFEFLSEGGGVWREVMRTVGHDSRAYYVAVSTVESITGGGVFMHYDTKVFDYQNEYDTAGGFFVPKQSGEFQVSAAFVTAGGAWLAGETCYMLIQNRSFPIPGATVESTGAFSVMPAVGAANCTVQATTTLRANPGEQIAVIGFVARSGGSLNSVPNPTIAFVSIVRLHN